jgi:hypothetical protein
MTYAPDGRSLAFAIGSREIAVLAGGRLRTVTTLSHGVALTALEWSRDGRRLGLMTARTGEQLGGVAKEVRGRVQRGTEGVATHRR